MLQIVGNKLRGINKNLFPIKAKTLMRLGFKWNAKRKKPLSQLCCSHLGSLGCVLAGYHMFEKTHWSEFKGKQLN